VYIKILTLRKGDSAGKKGMQRISSIISSKTKEEIKKIVLRISAIAHLKQVGCSQISSESDDKDKDSER
jgi:hypothetical protein